MKRLVVALPDVACVGCGVRELPQLKYAHDAPSGSPPGSMIANFGPPPGWAELRPEQVPEGRFVRFFLICAACYEKGAPNGRYPTTAHVEEI